MNICLNLHFIFICSPIKRRCSLYLCMLRPLIFPLPWLPCRRPHRAWRCQGQVPGCAGQDESEAVGAAWRNGSRQQPSLWPWGWPQELWRCLEPRVVLTALLPLSITSAWNYSSISTYSLCIYPQSVLLNLFINFFLFSVYLSPVCPAETIHQFLLILGVFIRSLWCWNYSSISTYSRCVYPQSVLLKLFCIHQFLLILGVFIPSLSCWNYSSISTYSRCIYPQSILLKLFINFYFFSVYLSPVSPAETVHQFLLILSVLIPSLSSVIYRQACH